MSEEKPREHTSAGEPQEHAPDHDRAALIASLGQRLKEARTARKLTVEDVVRALKLRRVYVQALEDGRWEDLPDEVYALAFLKQYAAFLELDIADELNRLRKGQVRLTRPLTFPDPPIAPSRRWAWIAGAAFVVLIVAFNIWNAYDNEPPPAPAPEVAANSPKPSAPSATSTGTDAVQSGKKVAGNAATMPGPSPSSPEAAETPLAVQTSDGYASAPASGAPSAPVPPIESAQREPKEHRYRFTAVGDDVWLQVRLPSLEDPERPAAEPAREALLHPGESMTMRRPVHRLWVTTGNAGALRIEADDALVVQEGTLGELREVVRDIEVTVP